MARKLKTFTTSAGFFDLAVAAPSMKAALEAWASTRNLFHQGFAKIAEDPAIVEATMAKPGVVLRRPVGTTGAFSENAELPSHLASCHATLRLGQAVGNVDRHRLTLAKRNSARALRPGSFRCVARFVRS